MRWSLDTWHLNYKVAAFGAYATTLIACVNLIFGGIQDASPLPISILTSGSAIVVAGLSRSNALPPAAIRIGLTTLFLLWSTVSRPETEAFDGTYAILCSCAHLVYQLILLSDPDGDDVEDDVDNRECEKGSGGEKRLMHPQVDIDTKEERAALKFRRHLIFHFDHVFRLDGSMALITILGTVMTYRIFDFDLGFGLVFASFSAALCIALLLLINFTRKRERVVSTTKAVQKLVGIMVPLGIFCFAVSRDENVQELVDNVRWWKPTFGVAWFLWLFSMIYTPSRFLVHATLFPCAACRQPDPNHPLETNVGSCPWDNHIALPPLLTSEANEEDSTVILIRRQKGPDLVERYWLNDEAWVQISPRVFVTAFIMGICVTVISSTLQQISNNSEAIGVAAAFYIIMIFSLAATGHTAVGASPELMILPLKNNFRDWRATVGALSATIVVHMLLLLAGLDTKFPGMFFPGLLVLLVCVGMTPLLLAGVTNPMNGANSSDHQDEESEATVGSGGSTDRPNGDLGMARSAEASIFIMGHAIVVFDTVFNKADGAEPVTVSLVLLTTYLLMFLMRRVPGRRDIEPWILSAANIGLIENSFHFDILGLVYRDPSQYIDHAQSSLIYACLWYSTLFFMIMVNRRLAMENRDQASPSKNTREVKDHLIIGFRFQNCVWQLRNSRVGIVLVFAFFSTLFGNDWPIPINNTVASLTLYVIVVGLRVLSVDEADEGDEEERSNPHLAVLTFCTVTTTLALALGRYSVVDYGNDWQVGTRAAIMAYSFPLMVMKYVNRSEKPSAKALGTKDAPYCKEQNERSNVPTLGVKDHMSTVHA